MPINACLYKSVHVCLYIRSSFFTYPIFTSINVFCVKKKSGPKSENFFFFFNFFGGDFFVLYQHCFICSPSDSIVPMDAGIEHRTVATGASDSQKL
jgi:hypothetical protein